MEERSAADETICLSLFGELDLAAAGQLEARLGELRSAGAAVRLDLSRLTFIDCSGLAAILGSLPDADHNGWTLEVSSQMQPWIARVVAMAGAGPRLWPTYR